jgi:hypothetical protein
VLIESLGDLVLKGLRNPMPAFNVVGLKQERKFA